MIERFYAKNYKSFPSLELDLKNINILLGSNSCGKSSITKLLLMLSQTADSTENYNNILRPNGSKTSLGEAINIFTDKNPDKEFIVGWSLPDSLLNKEEPAFTHLNEILEYIAARHSNLFFNLDQDRRSEYEKHIINILNPFTETGQIYLNQTFQTMPKHYQTLRKISHTQ